MPLLITLAIIEDSCTILILHNMKAFLQSNKICINNQDCNSLVIRYRDESNVFSFNYDGAPVDFYQQIRIGAFLRSEKPEIKEKIYRRHNGTFKNTGVTIDKKKLLVTDWWDEETRDALTVASRHSEFIINDIPYSCQGEPDIEDNEFNNLATAKLEIYVQGFNQTNIAC